MTLSHLLEVLLLAKYNVSLLVIGVNGKSRSNVQQLLQQNAQSTIYAVSLFYYKSLICKGSSYDVMHSIALCIYHNSAACSEADSLLYS